MRALVLGALVAALSTVSWAKGSGVGSECTLVRSLKVASEPNGARKGTAKAGSVIMVLEQAGTWLLISGDGANGYVPAAELQKACKTGGGTGGGEAKGKEKAKSKPRPQAMSVGATCVIADVLKVSGAAKGKGAKSDLPTSTQITLKEISKGWVRVESAAGKGWATDKEIEARCSAFAGGDAGAKKAGDSKPQQEVGVDDAKPVPAAAFGGALGSEPDASGTAPPPAAKSSSSAAANTGSPPSTGAEPSSSTPAADTTPMVPLFGSADGTGNELFRNASASDTAELKARRVRDLAWVGMIGGSAGLVGGVVTYIIAAGRASSLKLEIQNYAAQTVRDSATHTDLARRRADIGHLDSYSAIAFGVGAAALGAGIALYVLGDDPSRFAKANYRLSGGGARAGEVTLLLTPSGVMFTGGF